LFLFLYTYTGEIKRFCAAQPDSCDINTPGESYPLMDQSNIPTNLFAVAALLSFTDPSCGPNIFLSSYIKSDKYGEPQATIFNQQKIIREETLLIESEIVIRKEFEKIEWYNGGKRAHDYIFKWNTTATISGTYKVLCVGCVSTATMRVFIHSLNPEYAPPTDRIYSDPITLVTTDTDQTYQVEFTITRDITGVQTINGQEFPETVYQGVGFEFNNLGEGSAYT
jgi:hypothetical protein